MKKRMRLLNLMMILFIALAPGVHATEYVNAEYSNNGSGNMEPSLMDEATGIITINGNSIPGTAYIRDEVLYLPVRAISEGLNYVVSWDSSQCKVGITGYGRSLVFGIKEGRLASGGHEYSLAPNPILIKDRTYLGQDFFSENLALKVAWDKEREQVHLTDIQENPLKIESTLISSETKTLKTFVQYPVIGGLTDAGIQAEINARFRSLAEAAVEEGKKNEAELAPYVQRYPDMPRQCETYFDYRVKFNQKGYLSLVFQNYQYSLGAHGSTVQTGYTINLETGQILTLGELFKEGSDYETLLNDAVKTQLAERNLWESLLSPYENITGEHEYYLTNQGLVIYYQQYAILPGAAGVLEFPVEYATMDKMLVKPDMHQ